MILTNENYFSREMAMKYVSVSQYKDFFGTVSQEGCEERALMTLGGEWTKPMSTALLVGSYVDAHFEGTLDVFIAQHEKEIHTKTGGLRSDFQKAEEVIRRIERDEYFMRYLEGEKQSIFIGEIFGVEFKCKIDALERGVCITDLKTCRSLRDSFWCSTARARVSFVEHWGYEIQAAVYQEIVRQNIGEQLPFFIAAASKEPYPDIEIIGFKQQELDIVLKLMEKNVNRLIKLKAGDLEPERCGSCDYCKHIRKLEHPVHYSRLINDY